LEPKERGNKSSILEQAQESLKDHLLRSQASLGGNEENPRKRGSLKGKGHTPFTKGGGDSGGAAEINLCQKPNGQAKTPLKTSGSRPKRRKIAAI